MRIIVVAAGACVLAAAALGPGLAWAGGHKERGAEAAAERAAEAAGERLGERIEAQIKAGGPFFTAEERAVIERKCGYPAGSFDGFEANINNGAFVCRGGRRVDDAEMRALLAAAQPRIDRRVRTVMESPEVRGAIRAVAEEAERHALASIEHAQIARDAAATARRAAREAEAEARRHRRR